MRLRITRQWDGRFDTAAFRALDPLLFRRMGDRGEAVIGGGARAVFMPGKKARDVGAFPGLKAFLDQHGDWAFGHLAYDLKNEVEELSSRHPDRSGFPTAHWFVPRYVVHLKPGEATLLVHPEDRTEGEAWLDRLLNTPGGPPPCEVPGFSPCTTKESYLTRVSGVLERIQHGDVYELNYCMERTAAMADWDPFAAFHRLLTGSDAPHAAFYRMGHLFALCASPERFLRIEKGTVRAQPMKGTRPRHPEAMRDRALAAELATDPKERSENIMAVDVMRNDLSRTAARGSVRVEELCAVKSHPAVHQMTSTVRSDMAAGVHPVDVVAAAWPMASMTGAPKVSAMRLIDAVEDMRRGLYSGSLGFWSPDGTLDLNVVIRTVLFDAATGRASLCTGSAITAACDPEKEWEEVELKARSVINALGHA